MLCSLHSSKPASQPFYIQGPSEGNFYQSQVNFLNSNIQSSFLAARKPCRQFHPKSQSDLSAGWQLLPVMKGLLISVSEGWEIRLWILHDCTICAVDIYWFIPSSHLSLTLQSIRGHNQLLAGIPSQKQVCIQFPVKIHFKSLLQKMDHLLAVLQNQTDHQHFGPQSIHQANIIITNIFNGENEFLCPLLKNSR